MINLLF